jgi:NitT/TauT family transport system ATP-binding protein
MERMPQHLDQSRVPRPADPTGLAVAVHDVGVSFPAPDGPLEALRGFTLDVEAGSFTAVIGPNGCGKSTLLRTLAGLLAPITGSVRLDGAAPRAGDPRVGIAFQQPRLLPWLSTLDNVELPLALGGVPRAERRARAIEALRQVGIADAARLRPGELSGGMAQRAGLARALVTDPQLLLLDEPFSALDALTREAFDSELQRLWMERRRTVILVTHSVAEAVRLADRVAVMTARPGTVGRLVQVDLPRPRGVGDIGRAEEEAVREALGSVHPPELAPWTPRA